MSSAAALVAAAFLTLPANANGRGVAVSLEREQRGDAATIRVHNPGSKAGVYRINIYTQDGTPYPSAKITPNGFNLSRYRSRRVRITNLPKDAKLCATVNAAPTLDLQSCAPRSRGY